MDKEAVMLHVIVSHYSDTPHIKLQLDIIYKIALMV